jgi:hypothetical protein
VGERGRNRAWIAGVLVCVVGAVAAATAGTAKAQTLDPAFCDPQQHTFTLNIDNPYFPLPVSQEWVYSGREQGQTIGLQITVLPETETLRFRGTTVTTRVVREVEWVDANRNFVIDSGEELIEVSWNYFAQTEQGTVCYFGEIVDIYEGGVVVSHEGSWRADAKGNAPGIFMPANPEKGMTFQQENAPGVAEDTATIIKVGKDGVITVRDFNPLDGSSGTKQYEQDVGLIRDGPLDLVSCSGPIRC